MGMTLSFLGVALDWQFLSWCLLECLLLGYSLLEPRHHAVRSKSYKAMCRYFWWVVPAGLPANTRDELPAMWVGHLEMSSPVEPSDDWVPDYIWLQSHERPQLRTSQMNPVNPQTCERQMFFRTLNDRLVGCAAVDNHNYWVPMWGDSSCHGSSGGGRQVI